MSQPGQLAAMIASIVAYTGMKDQQVRDLLVSGWSFSANIKGEYKWEKHRDQDLIEPRKVSV